MSALKIFVILYINVDTQFLEPLITLIILLLQRAESLLKNILEEKYAPAIEELTPYLTDSFGNSTRIDYGTGIWDFYCWYYIYAFILLGCCIVSGNLSNKK